MLSLQRTTYFQQVVQLLSKASFWVFVLRSTPNLTRFKHRYPSHCYIGLRHVHLRAGFTLVTSHHDHHIPKNSCWLWNDWWSHFISHKVASIRSAHGILHVWQSRGFCDETTQIGCVNTKTKTTVSYASIFFYKHLSLPMTEFFFHKHDMSQTKLTLHYDGVTKTSRMWHRFLLVMIFEPPTMTTTKIVKSNFPRSPVTCVRRPLNTQEVLNKPLVMSHFLYTS